MSTTLAPRGAKRNSTAAAKAIYRCVVAAASWAILSSAKFEGLHVQLLSCDIRHESVLEEIRSETPAEWAGVGAALSELSKRDARVR